MLPCLIIFLISLPFRLGLLDSYARPAPSFLRVPPPTPTHPPAQAPVSPRLAPYPTPTCTRQLKPQYPTDSPDPTPASSSPSISQTPLGVWGMLGLELAGKCGGLGVFWGTLGLELAGTRGGWVWVILGLELAGTCGGWF